MFHGTCEEFSLMRSLLARLAFVGLVGAALVGCGTSSGTTLPAGSLANNSGGGPINSTNGLGAPPAGFVPATLIDDGTLAKGSYSFNVVAVDAQSAIQAGSDPGAAIASPSDGTDAGSHQIGTVAAPVTGNGLTQIILKYSGAVPNLTYVFGGFGNSTSFNYGTIVAHFWRNIRASSTVTMAGSVLTPTDVTVFIASQPVTYLAQVGVDTPATVAAGLAQLINQNTVVGPTGTLVQTYAFVNPATPTVLTIAPVTSGAGGNGITVTTAVTPLTTLTATSSGSTANGATVAGTQLPAPTWQLELVGNGANAGVGTVANTYDVRITCASNDIVGTSPQPLKSVNRFTCPLPAYGTPSSNQNAPPPAAGVATYTPGPNAILPGAAGAFTPINPTLYLVLTYATGTVVSQQDIIDVDYLYAIQ
jgi:hypothetical protein